MSVSLTKIIEGKPVVADDLTNEVQVIQCPRCEQTYRLGYSDTEWHRVKDRLQLAAKAIRKEHDLRHEADDSVRMARHTEKVITRERGVTKGTPQRAFYSLPKNHCCGIPASI